MMVSGRTIFNLKDAHGLPIEVAVEHLSMKDMMVEWPSFIDAAREAGWWDFKIYSTLENIFLDTPTLNRQFPNYKDGLLEKVRLYTTLYPHPMMVEDDE